MSTGRTGTVERRCFEGYRAESGADTSCILGTSSAAQAEKLLESKMLHNRRVRSDDINIVFSVTERSERDLTN